MIPNPLPTASVVSVYPTFSEPSLGDGRLIVQGEVRDVQILDVTQEADSFWSQLLQRVTQVLIAFIDWCAEAADYMGKVFHRAKEKLFPTVQASLSLPPVEIVESDAIPYDLKGTKVRGLDFTSYFACDPDMVKKLKKVMELSEEQRTIWNVTFPEPCGFDPDFDTLSKEADKARKDIAGLLAKTGFTLLKEVPNPWAFLYTFVQDREAARLLKGILENSVQREDMFNGVKVVPDQLGVAFSPIRNYILPSSTIGVGKERGKKMQGHAWILKRKVLTRECPKTKELVKAILFPGWNENLTCFLPKDPEKREAFLQFFCAKLVAINPTWKDHLKLDGPILQQGLHGTSIAYIRQTDDERARKVPPVIERVVSANWLPLLGLLFDVPELYQETSNTRPSIPSDVERQEVSPNAEIPGELQVAALSEPQSDEVPVPQKKKSLSFNIPSSFPFRNKKFEPVIMEKFEEGVTHVLADSNNDDAEALEPLEKEPSRLEKLSKMNFSIF